MKPQLEALVRQMHDGGILYSEGVREFKKAFITHVLQERNGNQSRAAQSLGMHRNTLSRTLSELQIELPGRAGMRRPAVGVSSLQRLTKKRLSS
jgi:Fis family transcriptional regulator, factor for inversion stimulation protein